MTAKSAVSTLAATTASSEAFSADTRFPPEATEADSTTTAASDSSSDAKKPLYWINSKGFMQFSDSLVVNDRYQMRRPVDLEELETTHGKGRYGSVYCVKDLQDGGRIKALKILKLAEDGDDNFIRRELKVLRRITAGEMALVSEYDTSGDVDMSSSSAVSLLKAKSDASTSTSAASTSAMSSGVVMSSSETAAVRSPVTGTGTDSDMSATTASCTSERGLIDGCPFVISLLDYGAYRSHAYFVFHYCEVTLQEHLQYIFALNLPLALRSSAKSTPKPVASASAASAPASASLPPWAPSLRVDMADASLILSEYVNFNDKSAMMHPFDVWMIYWQLLNALSYIHTICKVMHLDFKPNNIMIRRYKCALIHAGGGGGAEDHGHGHVGRGHDEDGAMDLTLVKLIEPRIMLIDFSVSTRAPRHVDLDTHPCKGHYGTRRYRAPEMIYGGIWNRSIDTFGASLIIVECINVVRVLENKYRDEFGRRFKRRKHARGTKKYEKREIVDYLKRMAKTIMGKPSQAYSDGLLTDEWKAYFDDILELPQSDKSPVLTVKRRVEDMHISATAAAAATASTTSGGGKSKRVKATAATATADGSAVDSGVLSSVFGHRRRASGTIRLTRTLSEANQCSAFIRKRETLIREYFAQYRRFVEAKMFTDADLKRLTVLERLLNQVFVWEVSRRITPEEALEAFFRYDREYMCQCLDMSTPQLKDEFQSRERMLQRKAREKEFIERERRLKKEVGRLADAVVGGKQH